jgi:hypothetical protein
MAVTAIGAAVTLYAANEQAGAAEDAAGAAGDASAASIAEQRRQYNQTRQDQMPWLDAGQWALGQQRNFLQGDYSAALAGPDYRAANDMGLRALDRGTAANLSLTSGGADADRVNFGQQLASQYLGNHWNRLAGMSNTGQATGNQLGGFGANMANQVGQNMWGAAGARGSAYGQRADAYGQAAMGLGGLFNNWYQGQDRSMNGGWYFGNQPGRG